MTVDVTYNPGLRLSPNPLTPTEVTVDGSGTCTVTNGTTTTTTVGATLEAEGTNLAGAYTCAGGVAVGTGTFDVHIDGYPSQEPGRAVITVTGAVATVTIEADDLSVTASGAFVQDLPTVGTCNSAAGFVTTTWEGTVAFEATTVMPPITQDGQRSAQVSPSSTEQ